MRLPRSLQRLTRGPALAWDIVRVLPTVMEARRALAGQRDVREVLRSVTPGDPARDRSSPRSRWRTVRAIRWAFKLLRLGPAEGECLPQALATYSALRRQGWPVVFVSGVRRDGERVLGHAWVELDGVILTDSEQMAEYRENFRYPAS